MSRLRTFDSLFYQLENNPLQESVSQLSAGKIISTSTAQLAEKVNKLSVGLLKEGYKAGDRFSISAFNSTTWAIIDLAASQIGMVHVPLYPNASENDYQFIIEHAEVKAVFAGDDDIAEKLKNATRAIENIKHYALYNSKSFKNWEELLHPATDEEIKNVENLRNKIKSDELATIIYTSGTTGEPKGVMLSHDNIMSNASDVAEAIGLPGKKYKVLSFLPLCHIFERTALYTYLYTGMSIYYPENLDNLGEDLKLVKPQFFTTVPRVLEKIYEKIEAKAATLSPTKQKIFHWAMNLAKAYDPGTAYGIGNKIKFKIADKLVFKKWRDAVGNNILFIVSGAAALQPQLVRIFTAAGIPILEAYGLTEASPGITMTRYEIDQIKPGSVGSPIKSVKIKLNDDGEILASGPNIMMGYYKRPDATAEVMVDGWLKTGDQGTIDEDGNLYITGRKKEIFKTSGGKYIAPQKLENLLKASSLVDQVVILGEDKKFPSALIVPSFEALKRELPALESEGMHGLNENSEVRNMFQEMIDEKNQQLGNYEKIKKFYILDNAWTIEGGELTPTLKIKRKIIEERHLREITSLYQI